ncbi:MAG TPA: hypothetical protein VK838_06175 [Candidatus Limnocylindrales bacterium]|nr:hypothetical protein [Candidatus Limnocylindrales bacterium]
MRTVWIHPTPSDLVDSHEIRVAQLRREIHGRRPARDERPLRRWVGRQLVRAGEKLAADPSLRPVRSL